MDDLINLLKSSHYQDNPLYKDKSIFYYTGNVHDDWLIFKTVLDLLGCGVVKNIDDYFYWLNFSKTMFYETNGFTKDPYLDRLVLDKTDNFMLTLALGAIVPGYVLVSPLKHALSMSALSFDAKKEYVLYLNELRDLFIKAFGSAPIIFEHGSNVIENESSNSIFHAHTHIVNHHFQDEASLIARLHMTRLSSVEELLSAPSNSNYISYISPANEVYYTDSCQHESQLMRRVIARDLKLGDTWNWRKYPYYENMFETAKNFTLQRIKDSKKK